MSTIVSLYEQFLKERQYVIGVTPKTLRSYRQAFATCHVALPAELAELTPQTAKDLTIWLQQNPYNGQPRSADGINVYLRVFNAFFKWLSKDYGHLPIRLPLVKVERKIMPTYSPEHIRKILEHRPTDTNMLRVRALWVLAIDTGCRIEELLTLQRDKLSLDNCTATVFGKGRKERQVPFSIESRRVLYGWIKTHSNSFVFATRSGLPVSARNAARDLSVLLNQLSLPRVKRLWHSTRRTFGTTYIRNGGDVFRLQQTLGHANLETTRRYVEIDIDDLRSVHASLSPLAVVRR